METKEKNTTKRVNMKFSFKEFLRGDFFAESFIAKNWQFTLFIVVLFMGIMYNKFLTEKVINEINKTRQEVSTLKAVSVSNTAELMRLSKESVVLEMVKEEGLGIKPLKNPPEKIVIKNK